MMPAWMWAIIECLQLIKSLDPGHKHTGVTKSVYFLQADFSAKRFNT